MARKFRVVTDTEKELIKRMYFEGVSANVVASTVKISLNITLKILRESKMMRQSSKGIKTRDVKEYIPHENKLIDTANNAFNIARN